MFPPTGGWIPRLLEWFASPAPFDEGRFEMGRHPPFTALAPFALSCPPKGGASPLGHPSLFVPWTPECQHPLTAARGRRFLPCFLVLHFPSFSNFTYLIFPTCWTRRTLRTCSPPTPPRILLFLPKLFLSLAIPSQLPSFSLTYTTGLLPPPRARLSFPHFILGVPRRLPCPTFLNCSSAEPSPCFLCRCFIVDMS